VDRAHAEVVIEEVAEQLVRRVIRCRIPHTMRRILGQ
jgi:hypothetical protein